MMGTDQIEAIRPLDILGISEFEERAYRWLINNPGATASELSEALPLALRKTHQLLDSIEAKGLVSHSPERPRRYIPASPDIAMEALALKRQEDLRNARSAIQELQEEATAVRSSDEQEQMVELITNRQAERQIFEHMRSSAQHEVITLIRPPLRISRLDVPSEEAQQTQREAQARGVKYLSIVDPEFMDLPGAIARVRSDMEAGEEVRISSHLPFKMMLADRRVALIPLNLQQSGGASLIVRSSALLDGLYALFEKLWERAAPVAFTSSTEMDVGEPLPAFPAASMDLLLLMSSGLNDKSIGYELGISPSTLNRRIAELMKSLDARTRFQLGWLAAMRSGKTRNE